MDRRDRILAEAARLFAASGFHRVGVDDIGAAVGISGPGIYRYFASKDAMLAELLLGANDALLRVGAVSAGIADPLAALRALVDGHVDFALGHPDLITVQDRDVATLPDPDWRRVRRRQQTYVRLWVGVLRRLRPTEPEPVLRAATHAALGLLNCAPRAVAGLDRPTLAALLRDMALRALTGQRSPAAATRPR